MADEIDDTDIRQQKLLDATIDGIRSKANINFIGDGDCLVCGNEVNPIELNGKSFVGRWCSVECRDRSDL